MRWPCILLACSSSLALHATTYRVGRDGDDLQALAAKLQPGDVLEVPRGPVYRGQIVLRKAGTPEQPITIRGLDRPLLATAGAVAGGAVVRFLGDHTIFENFEITGERDKNTARGLYNVADGVVIRDCVVRDVAGQGVQGSDAAGSLTLERVEIFRCGAGDRAHQIYAATNNARFPKAFFRMQGCYLHDGLGGNNVKSRASRTEIVGNWIEGSFAHELDLIGADPAGQAPGTAALIREDADVVGNVFRKRAGSIGYFARLGTDGTGASEGRYRFAYNTFVVDPEVRGTPTVFGAKAAVQAIEVYNNVFYSPGTRARVLYGAGFGQSAGGGNWASIATTGLPPEWKTRLGADPGFRDAALLDFAPRLDSPLAGAAVPYPLVAMWQPPTRSRPATPRTAASTRVSGAFEPPEKAGEPGR